MNKTKKNNFCQDQTTIPCLFLLLYIYISESLVCKLVVHSYLHNFILDQTLPSFYLHHKSTNWTVEFNKQWNHRPGIAWEAFDMHLHFNSFIHCDAFVSLTTWTPACGQDAAANLGKDAHTVEL